MAKRTRATARSELGEMDGTIDRQAAPASYRTGMRGATKRRASSDDVGSVATDADATTDADAATGPCAATDADAATGPCAATYPCAETDRGNPTEPRAAIDRVDRVGHSARGNTAARRPSCSGLATR